MCESSMRKFKAFRFLNFFGKATKLKICNSFFILNFKTLETFEKILHSKFWSEFNKFSFIEFHCKIYDLKFTKKSKQNYVIYFSTESIKNLFLD